MISFFASYEKWQETVLERRVMACSKGPQVRLEPWATATRKKLCIWDTHSINWAAPWHDIFTFTQLWLLSMQHRLHQHDGMVCAWVVQHFGAKCYFKASYYLMWATLRLGVPMTHLFVCIFLHAGEKQKV